MRGLKWIVVPILMIVLWGLVGYLMMLWPGSIYSIEGNVRVLAVHQDTVQLEMTRIARMPMQAVCTRQVVCENVVIVRTEDCPVYTAGTLTQRKEFPLPPAAFNGTGDVVHCFYAGVITLKPWGSWGPDVVVPWKSDGFIAQKPQGE